MSPNNRYNYETYLTEHRHLFEDATFEIQRCDDMQGDVIALVHVCKDGVVRYDYIGYFTCDEQSIRRIEEYWCERKKL